MKLQQQKHSAKIALEESKLRVMRNEPPTKDAINELHRRVQRRHRDVHDISTNQVRTTAEPRPNAYIPDVAHGLGVPKPLQLPCSIPSICGGRIYAPLSLAKLAGYYFLVGKKKILLSLTKPSWIPTTSSHSTYLATQIDVQKRPEEPSRCRSAFVEV